MHLRPFEIGLIVFFAVSALFGLGFLSKYQASDTTAKVFGESVTIWGTFDAAVMNELLLAFSKENKSFEVVKYREIEPRSFSSTLLNAIADGKAPDLVVMPHDLLVTYRKKIQPISYTTIPERTFRETYVDGADIFMRSDGIYGIPFAVDPLVMYWNRDIFSSSGLSQPPKTWETLVSQTTPAIVRVNEEYEISQSAVAFGEYANVVHAKEILSMLIMQAGSNIVEETEGRYSVTLNQKQQNSLYPGTAAVSFYTQFVMPDKQQYSWNRSKASDRKEFLNGTLGMYFALGSDRVNLERDNPNLNFDTAPVPQGEGVTKSRTYGRIYAFSILRSSQNIPGAFAVANALSSPSFALQITDDFKIAAAHRSLYTGAIADSHKNVLYQSALISHGWLEPSPNATNVVFQKLFENLTSENVRLSNIIDDASYQLEVLFK